MIKKKLSNKELFLICLGSLFEWAEYCLFGYFIGPIGQSLFPFTSEFHQHLFTWLIFASGLLSRFLGIYYFKKIYQKQGEKKALIVSMQTMALSTTAIALIPSYSILGLFAPFLFFCARLIQGLSMSGEFLLSTLYLYHYCDKKKRITQSALSLASASLGIILGGIVATCALHSPLPATLQWRVPFLLGSLFILFASNLRRRLQNEQQKEKQNDKKPLNLKKNLQNPLFLRLYLLFSTLCVDTYLCQNYFTSSMQRLGMSSLESLSAQIFGQAIVCLTILIISSLAKEDKIQTYIRLSLLSIALCAFPFFLICLKQPYLAQFLFGISYGSLCAVLLGYTCSFFPSFEKCYLGLALPWSLAATSFGAFSPSLCLVLEQIALVQHPAAWIICTLSLLTLIEMSISDFLKKSVFSKKIFQN